MVVSTAAAAIAAIGPSPSSKWSGTNSVEYPSASSSRTVSDHVRPSSGPWTSTPNRNRCVVTSDAHQWAPHQWATGQTRSPGGYFTGMCLMPAMKFDRSGSASPVRSSVGMRFAISSSST